MKITMYELLGMVKDGKAPIIIKYANYIWTYEKCVNDYTNDNEYLFADVMCNADDNAIFLNEKVEILEEEKKIPEKLNLGNATVNEQQIEFKINEIIDYLKSKGE